MISMILASDINNCIGANGKLPWHDKLELKHFREYTTGKTIVMGMNTWKSFNQTPLPKRLNVVCVDDRHELDLYNPSNVLCLNKELILNLHNFNPKQEMVIIGGAKTYKEFEDVVTKILWSRGNFEVENGDTYYSPPVDNGSWSLSNTRTISDKFKVETYLKVERPTLVQRVIEAITPITNISQRPALAAKEKS